MTVLLGSPAHFPSQNALRSVKIPWSSAPPSSSQSCSLLSRCSQPGSPTQFGVTGVYSLAAITGVTDIDPFVLNLAQGGTSAAPNEAIAPAILIATSQIICSKRAMQLCSQVEGQLLRVPLRSALLQSPASILRLAWLHPHDCLVKREMLQCSVAVGGDIPKVIATGK
jgi:hypothetical protein